MTRKQTITNRVKFLISYLIGKGIAENQEDLGKKINIDSKSYLSQLVNGKQNNTSFINKLMEFAPEINIDWLYDETVESPFTPEVQEEIAVEREKNNKEINEINDVIEKKLKQLEDELRNAQKDAKYFSDIANIRQHTIEIQNKLIAALENQLSKIKR